MEKVAIVGELRTETGKTANKALRRAGRIPAVLYGGDVNINFSTTGKEVKSLVYTPNFKTAEITIDGTTYNCILKDIQLHPVTDEIVHIDFLRMVENHPIKYQVPIKFKGSSPGVIAGGKLIQQMRKVKLKSVPSAMVDSVFADISKIELGDSSRVKDLEIPENVEIENEPATPVAIVLTPRALKEMNAPLEDLDAPVDTEEAEESEEAEAPAEE